MRVDDGRLARDALGNGEGALVAASEALEGGAERVEAAAAMRFDAGALAPAAAAPLAPL